MKEERRIEKQKVKTKQTKNLLNGHPFEITNKRTERHNNL